MENIVLFKLNRILAALIDGLLMFVLFWAIFIYPLIESILALNNGTFYYIHVISLVVFFSLGALLDVFYLFLTSIAFKGATLGMKIVNLNYAKYDGSVPSRLALFFHSLTLVIGMIASLGLSIVVDFFSLLSNEFGRSVHDIFLGMKMVNIYDL